MELNVSCDDLVISDHSLISTHASFIEEDVVRKLVNFRPINRVNPQDIRNGINNIVCDIMGRSEYTFDSITNDINHELMSLLENLEPLKEKSLFVLKQHPWFTDEMSVLKCEKRRLEKQ